jgi:TonB family protein
VSAPRFDADYLDNPAPAYPALSRRMGEHGRVLLRVHVTPEGSPAQIEVRESSGFERLDKAARDTVRRWRFVPAKQGDRGVAAWVLVPISFSRAIEQDTARLEYGHTVLATVAPPRPSSACSAPSGASTTRWWPSA